MINRFIRFSLIILSFSTLPAQAQTDSLSGYSIQHFTDENGLPQNSINDLLFDKNGFLWLGSQVGLIRFTGSSFKVYYPGDKPMMESNITRLAEDEKGNIFFQTLDQNLYCYSAGKSHQLRPVNTPARESFLLLNSRNQLFDFTRFLTNGSPGRDAEKRVRIFRDLSENNDHFYVIDSAHLYLRYHDTLYYYDQDSLLPAGNGGLDSNLQYFTIGEKLYLLRQDQITAVYYHGQSSIGHSLLEGDLRNRLHGRSAGLTSFRLFTGKVNHLLVGSDLYRLRQEPDGKLYTEFLLRLNLDAAITRIDYNPDLELLLVATETDGFYFLHRSRFCTPHFSPSLQRQLSQYLFGPMTSLRDGSGILTDKFIFRTDGQFHPLTTIDPIWQKCLYIDQKNNTWVSNFNLPRCLPAEKRPEKIYPALDGQIVDYAEDKEGQLYCLTETALWRLETDSFHCIFKGKDLLKGTNETMGLAGAHQLWIGNTDGLIEFDLQKRKAIINPLLRNAHVRSIVSCRDGSVLVGTYGQGYFYYHHDSLYRMPLDKNGFLVTAHCFLEDRKGMLWISCNKGLFKVPRADLDAWCDKPGGQIYYYYFGHQDGLPTNEFNGGFNSSGLVNGNGFISLLSMKGIICFYADSLHCDFPTGCVNMTNVEIDGQPWDQTGSIRLNPDYNSLLLEISCPFIGNRNNLYLQYNLKGLNNEWKEVPEDGLLSLNRLAPGHYTLRVRKINGFGKENYLFEEWEITVRPHLYQTSWFIICIILGMLVLLSLLIQQRLNLLQKRKELRQKAEKLKGTVSALQETVSKLEESQQALLQTSKLKEKLISLVIHDLRSPLRFLSLMAGDLHDKQDQLSAEEIRERSYWVKKGTQDVYNFSEDFLLWVTSQRNNFSISKREVAVGPLLQELHDFFRDQVQQKGNSISFHTSPQLTIFSDPHILITIIRNLVDNANKYTDKGSIRIEACKEGSSVVFTVSDTGKGMTAQQVESFYQQNSLDDLKSGTQLGHRFVSDLTRRINGTVLIRSKEGEGTTVRLRFE